MQEMKFVLNQNSKKTEIAESRKLCTRKQTCTYLRTGCNTVQLIKCVWFGKEKCHVHKYSQCHPIQTSQYCHAEKCCQYIKKVGKSLVVKNCKVGNEVCKTQKCACPYKRCECPSTVSYVCAGGRTYQNACVAKCAGATSVVSGKCAKVCPPKN